LYYNHPSLKPSLIQEPNKKSKFIHINKSSLAQSAKASNIPSKIKESLNARKASNPDLNEAKLDKQVQQINKEIEESQEEEEEEEAKKKSPIKKVSGIKATESNHNSKNKKAQNKKKDSHKSKECTKETEKAAAKEAASLAATAKRKKNSQKAKIKKTNSDEEEENSQSKSESKEKTNTNSEIDKILINDNNSYDNISEKSDSEFQSAIYSEVDKLKSQVKNLIEMNDALVKRLEKIDIKKHESKIDKNISSFMQKYESKVKDIDSKLKDEAKAISADLYKKLKSYKKTNENTNINFNEIKSHVKSLNEKINEIEKKRKENDYALKTGFDGDSLTVENNVNVKGLIHTHKLFTKEINLQNVLITEKLLKVKEDTRLEIGSESFDFSEVAKLLGYVDTIKAQCGEDLQLCSVVNKEEKSEIEEKKKRIVDNLKSLKVNTNRVLAASKRSGREGKKDRNLRR